MKRTLYHGSYVQNLDEIGFDIEFGDVGIHFGTLEQATNRFQTAKEAINPFTGEVHDWVIYGVDVELSNPLPALDIGSWNNPATVIRHFRTVAPGVITGLKKDAELTEIMDILDEGYDENLLEGDVAHLYESIRQELAAEGYDSIIYRNMHENTLGDLAFISEEFQNELEALEERRRLILGSYILKDTQFNEDDLLLKPTPDALNWMFDEASASTGVDLSDEDARILLEIEYEQERMRDEQLSESNSFISIDPDKQVTFLTKDGEPVTSTPNKDKLTPPTTVKKEAFPGPPPWHWNCRTALVPVLKSEDELTEADREKLSKSTRASMNGQVPETMTYDGFFKTLSESEQKEVLGQKKWEIWKRGNLKMRDMIDQTGNELTIGELEVKYA